MNECTALRKRFIDHWTMNHHAPIFLIGAVLLLLLTACGQVVTPWPTEVPPSATPSSASSHRSVHRPTGTALFVPPLETATPTPAATPRIHVVEPGDTLQAIAFDYGVRVDALQRVNAIENPQLLQIGQRLIIPLNEDPGRPASSLLLPTPTPQPVQVQGTAFFRTPVGSLWGLGEVANTTAVTLTNVHVNVMLFDAAGELVAENDAFAAADLIPPGASSPFGLLFTSPPDWASYQMTVVRADNAGALANAYIPISVTDLDGSPLESQFRVSGTVKHVGADRVASSVDIIVTTYDGQGVVTGFRHHTISVDEGLAPGATASFTVLLTAHGESPEAFSVVALGHV